MIGWKRPQSRHDKALALLDQERDLLLSGPVRDLGDLAAVRDALVSELLADAAPPPEEFLVALKAKAERNGRLLRASLAGLRAAQDQIAEADHAARSLKTYTAAGTARDVSRTRITREKRS